MFWWIQNQWYLWHRDKAKYSSVWAHLEDNLYWLLHRRHIARISAEQVRIEQGWMNLDIALKTKEQK